MIPEAANEMLTIDKIQTTGARSSFKYLRSFRNSRISCNEIKIITSKCISPSHRKPHCFIMHDVSSGRIRSSGVLC